ncbi:MAG: hypothetical protein IPN72_05530 [Saprospiraceae bacterium]|nr:hypothetical protein [Saprospiraceae bacterium]
MIPVIIILNNCSENKINYGYESRLMSARIKMDCAEDNLAVYNAIGAYRLKSADYRIEGLKEADRSNKVFSIHFPKELIDLVHLEKPWISICVKGKEYIGRGMAVREPNFPPECNFYFIYTESGQLNLNADNQLFCYTSEFVPLQRYKLEVLGIK